MNQIKLKLNGETPFLMHNNRLANPLDKYAQEMSKKSGKRKKTIDDIWELARIEWEGGLYLYDGEVKIPMRVINKTFENGAKKQKNGMLYKSGCIIMNDYCPLNYSGKTIKVEESETVPNPALDDYFKKYMYQTMVRVGTATLLRTRPIFEKWNLEIDIMYEGSVINRETVIQTAEDAGRLVGIGEWNIVHGGQFGRFTVEVLS